MNHPMTSGPAADLAAGGLGYYTESCARYASQLSWERLPADVQQQAHSTSVR
jgi:hypothetical protein